jgi:hypothetical protein
MMMVTMKVLLSTQAGFQLQMPSGISDTLPTNSSILQYQTTSFRALLKAKYTEYPLPLSMS